MRRNDLQPLRCIMCTEPIPPERKSVAITCSKVCTKRRQDYQRSLLDWHECRYCRRPSSPEERSRYHAWRRWEEKGMKEEQSSAKLLREVERLKRKIAELEERNAR